MRGFQLALVATLIFTAATGCADKNFTRDVEARWCELADAVCAPPRTPLQAPILNQPTDAPVPSGPIYVIPPIYTPPPAGRGAGS